MKNHQITFVAASIALITLHSCKKSTDSGFNMKATVGATTFNATNCFAVLDGGSMKIQSAQGPSTTTPVYPYLAVDINGWNNEPNTFFLGTPTTTNSSGTTSYARYYTGPNTYKISYAGSVTITFISHTSVTGMFSFTCTDSTVVSNGSFIANRQ